jgi:CRP-like cAMP-binding protein
MLALAVAVIAGVVAIGLVLYTRLGQSVSLLPASRPEVKLRLAEGSSQGAAVDAVFYVQSSKVKLTVVSKSGKEAGIAILPQSSFFGEGCLAGRRCASPRPAPTKRAP